MVLKKLSGRKIQYSFDDPCTHQWGYIMLSVFQSYKWRQYPDLFFYAFLFLIPRNFVDPFLTEEHGHKTRKNYHLKSHYPSTFRPIVGVIFITCHIMWLAYSLTQKMMGTLFFNFCNVRHIHLMCVMKINSAVHQSWKHFHLESELWGMVALNFSIRQNPYAFTNKVCSETLRIKEGTSILWCS